MLPLCLIFLFLTEDFFMYIYLNINIYDFINSCTIRQFFIVIIMFCMKRG